MVFTKPIRYIPHHKQPYCILIADSSEIYPQLAYNILIKYKFEPLLAKSFNQAKEILITEETDLVVIDTDFDGERGFDFLTYIQHEYPHLPYILTTERNTLHFIDVILSRDIGNVLYKPLYGQELAYLIQRLITKKGIFGLQNYLEGDIELRWKPIYKSNDITNCTDSIFDAAAEWGFEFPNEMEFKLIVEEIMLNAVYHAWGYDSEKIEFKPISLKKDESILIEYGHNDHRFGIGITDFSGKLSKQHILKKLHQIGVNNQLLRQRIEKGLDCSSKDIMLNGRGLDLLCKLSGEYYINLHRDRRTEFIIIYNKYYIKDDKDRKNINILEF